MNMDQKQKQEMLTILLDIQQQVDGLGRNLNSFLDETKATLSLVKQLSAQRKAHLQPHSMRPAPRYDA